MHIRSIGTAVPRTRYTQQQCLEALRAAPQYTALGRRSRMLVEQLFGGDNGIATRHLALESLEDAFRIDPDTLHARFRTQAPALACAAARSALARAGLRAADCDALVVSTCTGYLCPGLSSHVIEGLGLPAHIAAYDLVGQGCAAALPNLALGRALLAGGARQVLSICVEVCSAAMYLDDDPGVLVSTCLFGDGAGAAVLTAAAGPAPGSSRSIAWLDHATRTDPARRDALCFEQRGGMLRNRLTRAVPAMAAGSARVILDEVLARQGLQQEDIGTWIMHAGGRDVLRAVDRRLGLPAGALDFSAATLRDYGNLSSAFVYFVLDAALRANAPPGRWWLASFGAGFSSHGALLEAAW